MQAEEQIMIMMDGL